MEIEANLNLPDEKEPQNDKPTTNNEMASAVEDLQTNFGGKGGNIADMKYIRLKIKTLKVNNDQILQ